MTKTMTMTADELRSGDVVRLFLTDGRTVVVEFTEIVEDGDGMASIPDDICTIVGVPAHQITPGRIDPAADVFISPCFEFDRDDMFAWPLARVWQIEPLRMADWNA